MVEPHRSPLRLPTRVGRPPLVSGPRPHEQVTQAAPVELQEQLLRRAAALPEVEIGPSFDEVDGTRALHLSPLRARGPAEAFLLGTEFAHLHPHYDGSMHMALPRRLKQAAVAAGWGVPHPDTGVLLVFGPRDAGEFEVVWSLLRASFDYALDGCHENEQD